MDRIDKEKNDMAISRTKNTDTAYNCLIAAGATVCGACGVMGNLYAESGFNPRNLENLCEKRLGHKYTDDTYTEAVDSGEISRELFLHPMGDSRQYGYGLCQWTSAGRKAGLYDLAKQRGVSIGDPTLQIEYMISELQSRYRSVFYALKNATTVQEASDIFLQKFEQPLDTGDSVKSKRANYGEQYLMLYQDNNDKEEGTMSLISNSGHDENGRYSGGRAGDQTGTEWALIPWYSRPWKCVLRHPNSAVRAKIAELGVKAAKNDLIGYDQGQRDTYWQHLKASNYDPSQITIACEADCSAGVIANVKAVGHLLNIDSLKNLKATYTGDMRSAFRAAGFTVLTDKKYLNGPDYLLAGDVLLNDGLHTATNIADGAEAGGNSTSTGSGSNSARNNVSDGQKWLNSNYGDKLLKFCGAKLRVDGDYGTKSRWATLAVWKDLMNRRYGTALDPTNENFFESCKKVASKATVSHGTQGTFTFLVQFILAAKGFYFGSMDALCGDGLTAAIKSFQKSKGLEADGYCGANTWYALFN